MTAEIIAVGTELLLGGVANTDAQDISQTLSRLRINCYYHTTVGDNPGRLKDALKIAASRADVIITTGGLGPTCDDLTKQTLCEFFGLELKLHKPTWDRIQKYFSDISRPVTENNKSQAMLPEGCTIFENDWGTAPGCAFESDGKYVLMLPGPPRECHAMLENRVAPYLQKLSGGAIHSSVIRVFGLGESAMEDMLRDRMLAAENPTIAPYAKEGECYLRVTASAESEEAAQRLTEPVVNELCEVLGDYVYGVDVEDLESVLGALLREKRLTLAAAESCTGGQIAARVTGVPGASEVFAGGAVAYQSYVKTSVLGVPAELIGAHGAVSEDVASAMAEGACLAFGADIGVSTTGLAGPGGDGSATPVGTVCIALHDAKSGESRVQTFHFGNDRARVRRSASGSALNMVRLYLQGKG